MSNIIDIPMNYEHGKIGFGQESPGYFRRELLDNNIYTTYDAIKHGFRTATTRSEKYYKGQFINFTKSNVSDKLRCVVTCDSYLVSDISKEEWSILEGWDITYFKLNPNILTKFQFQFKLYEQR